MHDDESPYFPHEIRVFDEKREAEAAIKVCT